MSDIKAAASYLIAAIEQHTDRELADDVLAAIEDLLPYNLAADLADLR